MSTAKWLASACFAGSCAVAGPCAAQTAPSTQPSAWPPPALTLAATTMPADNVRHGTPYSMDRGPYDLNAPTSIEEEIYEILEPHTAMFNVPFIEDPWNALIDAQRRLADSTGLRIAGAYTQLYQQASGGPGERWAMSGDVDLMFDWTLIGRGTDNPGRLVVGIEDRFKIGSDIPPSQLGREIGTLVNTTGLFNDQGLVIREFFWDQRLIDGRLRVLVGRGAPGDFFGLHRLQTANFAFFNTNFSGNVTMAQPAFGPMALVAVQPNDLFYVTGGAANAYSRTTEIGLNTLFDEGKIYTFGEVGVTPNIENLGRGRIALAGWNMPERGQLGLPSDWGLNLTLEQYFAQRYWAFARYGYADTGLTGVKQGVSGGFAIDGLLGSPDNLTAFGVGYAIPSSNNLRDETSLEVFHRFQLTQHSQLTVGAQAIINPGAAPNDDILGVFSLRLRFDL